MSIKQGFLVIAVTLVALLGAIFYLMTLEARNLRALAAATTRRVLQAGRRAATELR
jgi:hypothetical protein